MVWLSCSKARAVGRWLASLAAAAGGLGAGCGGSKTQPQLAAADADLGLGDVVMMTWTTREAAGLLGHALSSDEINVDPHRRAMLGTERFVPTDQTLSVVVSREHTASIAAKYGPVGGQAEGATTTHVAYEVRITGYLELGPADLHYRAESGCCSGGALSGSCGEYYVLRLIRGSGKAEYLQKLDGKVTASAMDVVHANGGTAFRKLSTSHFEDTYFAYELAPMQGVCALLTPEEEMVPMKVAAADNCFLTAYQESGSRIAEAWHLPDARLCWSVGERRARQIETLLEFHVRFSNATGTRLLSAADASAAPADAAAAAAGVSTEAGETVATSLAPLDDAGSPPAGAGAPPPPQVRGSSAAGPTGSSAKAR